MKSSRFLLLPLLLLGCRAEPAPEGSTSTDPSTPGISDSSAPRDVVPSGRVELATVAGGCFWCIEAPFEKVPGVLSAVSGYTGGHVENPTYKDVGAGRTGHTEAVQVAFDPEQISYADVLEVFWRQFDPTDGGGSFVDRGSMYRPGIFTHSDEQLRIAEASRAALEASGRFENTIVTEILPLDVFYPAEEYHQDFYRKSPDRYNSYRRGSGRDKFLDRVWGAERHYMPSKPTAGAYMKPADEELRERLSPLQYRVTQEDGTERAFTGEYWDNKAPGIYVDIVSGEPLFSSLDKYDSGTGWPSFTRPLIEDGLTEHTDRKLGYARTEVRSTGADSHLGHVFSDGPAPTGLRYCINSAALRFVPVDELEKEGLGRFRLAFEAEAKE